MFPREFFIQCLLSRASKTVLWLHISLGFEFQHICNSRRFEVLNSSLALAISIEISGHPSVCLGDLTRQCC